ncbi:MAG: NHL repeat-containing protein [Solirubrobacteraceae bacterium]
MAAAVVVACIAPITGALGATPPVKLVAANHFGWEVNKTTGGNVCAVESKNECQPGVASSQPDGFESPEAVAGAPNGSIYVAESLNARVQELTSKGEFVLMFGKDVNATTKGDICTQEEIIKAGVKCKAGETGNGAGAFAFPRGIAIDPSTGNVYVADSGGTGGSVVENDRVEEYTNTGQFILTFGKEVNATTKSNICTEEEVSKSNVKCKEGIEPPLGTNEPGAFSFRGGPTLAVGPTNGLLYVGEEHRVQEFEANGQLKGEIPLTSLSAATGSHVSALAVNATGELYLVYSPPQRLEVNEGANVVRVFDPDGKEVRSFEIFGKPVEFFEVNGLAVDSSGRLAVTVFENKRFKDEARGDFGGLYDAATGHLITEFTVPASQGIGFNGAGELFSVASPNGFYSEVGHEVVAYKPEPVAELLPGPTVCNPGVEVDSSQTFDCTLSGEANPEEVGETEVWFDWGSTPALGQQTGKVKVATGGVLVKVSAPITGLLPNEQFYTQTTGVDSNVQLPEFLSGVPSSFRTPTALPVIVGQPEVGFVSSSSAVMSGVLNPENANTRYRFQYGPCETLDSCSQVGETVAAESPQYGKLEAILEATELQPATTYHYRLLADDGHEVAGALEGGETHGAEGTFTTAPAPLPQALTGGASAVSATSAVISGSVNPDGRAATYTFEMGVQEGAATQYGVVVSGPAGTEAALVAEARALSGLQPGTTYAYRISVSSGYIDTPSHTIHGQTATFTTLGLPAVVFAPVPLAQLSVPAIAFPKPVVTSKAKKKAKAKKKTKRHKPKKTTKRTGRKG